MTRAIILPTKFVYVGEANNILGTFSLPYEDQHYVLDLSEELFICFYDQILLDSLSVTLF